MYEERVNDICWYYHKSNEQIGKRQGEYKPVGRDVKSSSSSSGKDEIYNQRVSANGCDSDETNQDPIPVCVVFSNAIYRCHRFSGCRFRYTSFLAIKKSQNNLL